SVHRATALAWHVCGLARAVDLRLRAFASALASPPRARDVLRRGLLPLVAGDPGPLSRRGESALPLCRLRPRLAARPLARAAAPSRLRLLRACPGASVGTHSPRGSADRRPDDGRRASGDLLRGLRVLRDAVPPP